MKYLSLILLLLGISICSVTAADLTERQEELSEQLKLLSVDDDDFEDDNDNEFFVLHVKTSQDANALDLTPTMRVTVKLFDKKTKTTVFAQKEQGGKRINDRYTGTTRWEFHIPFGDMKKPKLEAYAVELGLNEGGTFIAGAFEYDGVESADEIMSGEGSKVQITKSTCAHDSASD